MPSFSVQHFMKPLQKFLKVPDMESIFINIEVMEEIIHTSGMCKVPIYLNVLAFFTCFFAYVYL